jgi:hypothetical protein
MWPSSICGSVSRLCLKSGLIVSSTGPRLLHCPWLAVICLAPLYSGSCRLCTLLCGPMLRRCRGSFPPAKAQGLVLAAIDSLQSRRHLVSWAHGPHTLLIAFWNSPFSLLRQASPRIVSPPHPCFCQSFSTTTVCPHITAPLAHVSANGERDTCQSCLTSRKSFSSGSLARLHFRVAAPPAARRTLPSQGCIRVLKQESNSNPDQPQSRFRSPRHRPRSAVARLSLAYSLMLMRRMPHSAHLQRSSSLTNNFH